MLYNCFIPQTHLGPLLLYFYSGTTLRKIKNLIIGDSAKFEISRKIISNRNILYSNKQYIYFNLNKWKNVEASYFNWSKKLSNLCYIETQLNLMKEKV